MTKEGNILPHEVAENTQLDRLTHVATWLDPQVIAERLGISPDVWGQVEDEIAKQITIDKNSLYTNVFSVDTQGELHFITNTIPDATLADILNQLRSRS